MPALPIRRLTVLPTVKHATTRATSLQLALLEGSPRPTFHITAHHLSALIPPHSHIPRLHKPALRLSQLPDVIARHGSIHAWAELHAPKAFVVSHFQRPGERRLRLVESGQGDEVFAEAVVGDGGLDAFGSVRGDLQVERFLVQLARFHVLAGVAGGDGPVGERDAVGHGGH